MDELKHVPSRTADLSGSPTPELLESNSVQRLQSSATTLELQSSATTPELQHRTVYPELQLSASAQPNAPDTQETLKGLSLLFEPNQTIFVCGPHDGVRYTDPRILSLETLETRALPSHNQFCINPLHPVQNRNPRPNGSRRCYQNVVAYQNFLLESDTLPVQAQIDLVPKLSEVLPIRAAVFSGGKSVHYFISVADTAPIAGAAGSEQAFESYKHLWRGLHKFAEDAVRRIAPEYAHLPSIFDNSTMDPVRLARLPGGLRILDTSSTPTKQELIYTGPLIMGDLIGSLSAEQGYTERKKTSTAPDPSMSVEQLERILSAKTSLHWLRNRLIAPESWAQSSNMYFTVFKYTLWLIDETGAPYNTVLCFMRKHMFPAIEAAGYPRDPGLGVYNAFSYKGLL